MVCGIRHRAGTLSCLIVVTKTHVTAGPGSGYAAKSSFGGHVGAEKHLRHVDDFEL